MILRNALIIMDFVSKINHIIAKTKSIPEDSPRMQVHSCSMDKYDPCLVFSIN